MEYELYHDESKEAGFWHGMLIVPSNKKGMLVELLELSRKNTGYTKPVGIKKTNSLGRRSNCVEAWCHIGVSSLISLPNKAKNPVFLGLREKGNRFYEQLDTHIGAKFILFKECDSHSKMTGHYDHGSKVETTFRMGLKGGIHLLGSDDDPITITKLHFDGWEHHQRRIDTNRIVGRLAGLREYCAVSDLSDDRTSNHENRESQPYDDCQLLQLTDVLIGSFRSAIGICTNNYQRRFGEIVAPLIERYNRGPARMKRSRWNKGFCLSQCELIDRQWRFSPISAGKNEKLQGNLFATNQ